MSFFLKRVISEPVIERWASDIINEAIDAPGFYDPSLLKQGYEVA